jgi:hypothetical protein
MVEAQNNELPSTSYLMRALESSRSADELALESQRLRSVLDLKQ